MKQMIAFGHDQVFKNPFIIQKIHGGSIEGY